MPSSLCSRVSPQHITGIILCSSIFLIFLFTVSSVSAKYCLLSLWPTTTQSTPASSSIAGEVSPVYAPLSSKYTFCAPSLMFVPSRAALTGIISMAGTQKTTSTLSVFTLSLRRFTSSTASFGVLFIFQFPAIIFFLTSKSLQNYLFFQ